MLVAKNYRTWLYVFLTVFFMVSLLSFLCVHILKIHSFFLPLLSGTLLIVFSLATKREKTPLHFLFSKDFQDTDSVIRFLRHELMNQLQIIYCLAQLGKKRRLEQAVNCLGEKTQFFKEIIRLESPKLISAAGGLLFSVSAEIPMTFEIAPTFSVPATMNSNAITLIDLLQSYLRSSSSKSVAISFIPKEEFRSVLEINIISSASCYKYGDLQAYFKEEKLIQTSNVAIQEQRIEDDILVRCSIALE